MFYLVSLFWILSISGLLVILTRKKFGIVSIISFLLGTLVLYVFSYFNKLRLGYYFTYIFVILFWLLILRLIIKKDKEKLKEFKDNYFTLGFVAFVILLIYCFFLFKYKGYEFCDEFTHWGPMLIASLKVNGFYAQPQDILDFHQDYPPFFTLLQCLWCGFDKFNYHEGYAYIALGSFMFSGFLPMFEKLNIKNKKDWLKTLIGIICVILVGITVSKTQTASDYAHVYSSIYVDWTLALYCAYCLFMIYREEEWGVFAFFNLSINLISMLLMKQMGICLFMLVLFYAFIKLTFIDKKLSIKKLVIGIVLFVVIPFAFYLSWKKVINLYELTGQFVISDFKFDNVLNIIRGNVEETWKTDAFYNFKEALFARKIVLHPFGMIYPVYAVLMSVLMVIVLKFKKQGWFIGGTYLIGAVGYAFAMMLLYILAFDMYEAPALASYDRYMMCYLYTGTTLLLMIAFNEFTKKKQIIYSIIILAVLCLFVENNDIDEIIPKLSVDDSNAKQVLVVRQFSRTDFHRENLNSFKMVFTKREFLEEGKLPEDEKQVYFTPKEWIKELQKYDLMYIDGYDDIFYKLYWKELNQKEDMYCFNHWLYSVKKTDSGVELTYNDMDFMYYVLRYYTLDY